MDRNEKITAPDDNLIRWDIRHIREDINLLCNLVMFQNSVIILGAYIAWLWMMK